jgi:NADPH2:quinone reductase
LATIFARPDQLTITRRQKMKAILAGQDGAVLGQASTPVPKPNEVLVRVRACGLNRADLGMAAGHRHGAHGGAGTVLR